jgi:F-box/WD-40 domain protein MET30
MSPSFPTSLAGPSSTSRQGTTSASPHITSFSSTLLPTTQEEGAIKDGRKLCVRHKQMANQNVNAKLQKVCCALSILELADEQSLDNLPMAERAAVTNLWSTFSNAPHGKRKLILEGILTMCCLWV